MLNALWKIYFLCIISKMSNKNDIYALLICLILYSATKKVHHSILGDRNVPLKDIISL